VAWLKDVLADREYEVIVEYLHNAEKYQDPHVKTELSEIALPHA
jgi:hypothetical protein